MHTTYNGGENFMEQNNNAWGDFIICLLFGYFGVHKFREHQVGMGILYLCTFGLFGIGWIVDCVKYFQIALHSEPTQYNCPVRLSDDEPLPVVASNVMLSGGEVCHYCGAATYVKTKNVVVGYTGGSRGTNIRIAKGVSVNLGSRKSSPIRDDVQERTRGILSITNKRIVFSANKGAFDKKISALSSAIPYQDCIAFQFGNQQYPLETRQSIYIYQILNRIVNSSDNIE